MTPPTDHRTVIVIDSPIGPLTLVGDDDALTELHLPNSTRTPERTPSEDRLPKPIAAAVEQLAQYFAGDRTEFDLPLAPTGTEFQVTVWSALQEIPYGETISYGELASRIGNPKASRAVGLANGRNPIAIIIPCHRVIGADGSLTGYGGGLPTKVKLLELESPAAQLSL